MGVIAVHNKKGGASKTMTASCTARCLREMGFSALVVDADEQWNITKQYGILKTAGVATIYDLLTDPDADARDAIQRTESGDIIPGDNLLKDAPASMLSLALPMAMLADALEPVRREYDWIVIDCPPSMGLVTRNAYVASDWVVVPVFGDPQSVENLSEIKAEIARIAAAPRLNPKLKLAGLLMTQYDGRKTLCRQIMDELPEIAERLGTGAFSAPIRQCEAARRACAAHQSPFDVVGTGPVVEDYRAFTEELIERVV